MTTFIDLFTNLADASDKINSHANNIHESTHAISTIVEKTALDTTTTSTNLFTPAFGAGVGAGCAMLGATGVGIGQGYTAGEAVDGLARNPKMMSKIRSTMLIGAAIAESSAIYALIISILLIFVR